MQIGVPKETALYENRIAITPDTIKKFIKLGHSIVVERDAGKGSFITNEALEQAGAQIVDDGAHAAHGCVDVLQYRLHALFHLRMLVLGTREHGHVDA